MNGYEVIAYQHYDGTWDSMLRRKHERATVKEWAIGIGTVVLFVIVFWGAVVILN